jgi:hypothetical protein
LAAIAARIAKQAHVIPRHPVSFRAKSRNDSQGRLRADGEWRLRAFGLRHSPVIPRGAEGGVAESMRRVDFSGFARNDRLRIGKRYRANLTGGGAARVSCARP